MDLIKIGKFITELRKEKGLTQEELGERIGVTNKTISRWETGTYLPPAEALLSMSELYDVSVNELLSGKRLSMEEYHKAAEDNLTSAIQASSYSLYDKIEFYRKKWLKEHIAIMVLLGCLIAALFAVGYVLREPLIGYAAVLLLLLSHAWRHNAMMTYVEKKAYDNEQAK